jgi:hypothetical protein
MFPKTIYLRIRAKSLAVESRLIKDEERRIRRTWSDDDRRHFVLVGLNFHRRGTVAKAARETNIALALLRGHLYGQIEGRAFTEPDWPEVIRLVGKYGPLYPDEEFKAGFARWLEDARAYFQEHRAAA